MPNPQPAIRIYPRNHVFFQPNMAPVFIGKHRTIGLKMLQDVMGVFRASVVMDTRDGNGFQEVCVIYEEGNDLYAEMQTYPSIQAWRDFIVGRINDIGKILPAPDSVAKSITCVGLDKLPFPKPTAKTPLPHSYQTTMDWLFGELSHMHWTLDHGYLELV